ncbi:hypothetical protein [Flavobacterium sp.]|uniref:hypothetical protein n=1 Tax=Flavobacterium sp. TaxID=239 RepID=UPI00262D0166|nr:hypothetical protein [Flavobacterium sp.]
MSIFATNAFASLNDPFDFGYTIDGKKNRPVVVFNDGEDTFIQAPPKTVLFLQASNVVMRGPYYVIKGVQKHIEGFAGGEPFRIEWKGAHSNPIQAEGGRPNGDPERKSFSGTFGKVAFVNGVPPDVGVVNNLSGPMDVKDVMKALAPQGWSGKADKSININETIQVGIDKGESWIVAIDKVVRRLNVWAEVDASNHTIHLRDTPTKSFSVVLNTVDQDRIPAKITTQKAKISDAASIAGTEPTATTDPASALLQSVNIERIQLKKDKIEFAVMSSKYPVKFYNQDGATEIHTSSSAYMTYQIPFKQQFFVESIGKRIEVKRVSRRELVAHKNSIGLMSAAEENGNTIFEFLHRLPNVRIFDGNGVRVDGLWEGDKLKVSVQSAEWKILTDQSSALVEVEDQGYFVWRNSSKN